MQRTLGPWDPEHVLEEVFGLHRLCSLGHADFSWVGWGQLEDNLGGAFY